MKLSSDAVKEDELEWYSHCSMYPFPPALTLVICEPVRCHCGPFQDRGWPTEEQRTVCPAPNLEVMDLREALKGLAGRNARHARIVELRFLGGLSNREVAGALEMTPEACERQERLALSWLRRELI